MLLFLRVLVILGLAECACARANPHFLEGCGGWRPCLETRNDSKETLSWFAAWNVTVQAKLDRLLTISATGDNHEGLLVVMAGDSTIIQQFQVLSEFVYLRDDYQPIQGPDAERLKKYRVTFGEAEGERGSITFSFHRVFEACMLGSGNPEIRRAYAFYFGCGMHLLHLLPAEGPAMLKLALNSWLKYETLLSARVDEYRKVNPSIKLVFMSTHTIDESMYFGAWLDALNGYKARDPKYLDICKTKFSEDLPEESLLRENVEQACIDTVFGTRGVELLNERALAAMDAAEVPVVAAHTLTMGQAWATQWGDGRHYPFLVPLELFLLLDIIEKSKP